MRNWGVLLLLSAASAVHHGGPSEGLVQPSPSKYYGSQLAQRMDNWFRVLQRLHLLSDEDR